MKNRRNFDVSADKKYHIINTNTDIYNRFKTNLCSTTSSTSYLSQQS